jgi:hypothetical protein
MYRSREITVVRHAQHCLHAMVALPPSHVKRRSNSMLAILERASATATSLLGRLMANKGSGSGVKARKQRTRNKNLIITITQNQNGV